MCQHHDKKEPHLLSSWLQSLFSLKPPLSAERDTHGLFQLATVTSIEPKWRVHPHIAEFYCTVTSWAFALPLLVFIFPPPGGLVYSLPSGIHSIPIEAPLAFSALTAVFSTLYHWTLWEVFSSLDTALAVMTFFCASLVTTEAVGHTPRSLFPIESFPGYASREVQFTVALVLAVVFQRWWKTTEVPAVLLFALCLPVPMWNLWLMDEIWCAVSIPLAVVFFLLDRLKVAPTHPLWHLIGGYSLYLCFYTSLKHYNQTHLSPELLNA